MASILDLISLLSLDAKSSVSTFGGHHRTILISKDYTNYDFVFNNLLQHFARKELHTPTLIITLSQDWANYSSCAAKCGSNLRRSQNRSQAKGNIEVLNMMSKYLEVIQQGGEMQFKPCQFIKDYIIDFIEHSSDGLPNFKPVIIMIDDFSILLNMGCQAREIYQLFYSIDNFLRRRSESLKEDQLSHLVIQTTSSQSETPTPDDGWTFVIANMENQSDIVMTLKPLKTGYSTRVDGTIKIVDNRLPMCNKNSPLPSQPALFRGEIGLKKAFFFKHGDRRVRLTSSALIY